MLKLILTCFIGIVVLTREACARDNRHYILSNGTKLCRDFVAAPEPVQEAYAAWALGFVSGLNAMDETDLRLTGEGWRQEGVLVWLKNYCSENLLARLVEAAAKLRGEIAIQQGLLRR
jgi:hypothetical protein